MVVLDRVQHQLFMIAENADHVAACGQFNRGSDDTVAAWSAINEITEQDNGIASFRRNGFQKCMERDGATVYVANRKCSASQV